ncbi:Cytochrome P450 family ent-kaurenoic acid oxidase [Melia azedarach]|uniref:(21S)-21-acetyl-1-hydroxy-apo-melianone synthase CYP88A164 n=2 Tax=Melia azedarach TaxID=155640 RepID=CA164_MELAZ|nr:Cytochrome P450 family ent-kaurenoic acid oxidase [Melia azedarach]WBW48724.1 CYP88A164 [Melia azedarach]
MGSDLLWLILAIVVGTYVVLFGFLRRANEWYYSMKLGDKSRYLPPGDMGWPIIGNMIPYFKGFRSGEPESFIFDLFEKYGRKGIYRNHIFGSPSIIVLAPEACRQVFLDDDNFKMGYPESTNKLTFRGSFNTASKEGQRRIRKLATSPIRGHKAIAIYIDNIEDIVVKSMNEWASKDKPIEFLSEMRKATFKVIANIFLGSSSESVIGSVEQYYVDYANGLISPLAINLPGFAFHKAMKARDMLGEILEPILRERRSMKEKDQLKGKRGLVDLLMEVEDENGEKLEDVDIVDMLIAFLSAGHESSAHIATWAIIHLHRHPEMLQKARKEQEEIVKKRPASQQGFSIEDFKQMEYIAQVIDETLRITNLSSSSFREAEADVNLQGYIIPKGWKVLLYNRGVHRNPENYPNPKEFDPSRWDNRANRPGYFIPFGGGPRICPGADLAKLEMSIFIHYFLLNYRLEPLNPECPTEYLPVPRPSDQCLARIVKLK